MDVCQIEFSIWQKCRVFAYCRLKANLQGAIWTSDIETGEPITGIDIIDNDKIVIKLNFEMAEMYSSYYEFDSHGVACWFNKEQQIKDKPKMLELLSKLKARLEEINDGSFEIEDLITPEYENL